MSKGEWTDFQSEQPRDHGLYKVMDEDGQWWESYWITHRLDRDYDYFDLFENEGVLVMLWLNEPIN